MEKARKERTLIIMKPDAIQRSLFGEILQRFERKGLKIIGVKMAKISDVLVEEHYSHLIDKPFFSSIKNYMQSSPMVLLALSGVNCISAVRLIVGPTKGYEADAGSIRGDFSMSGQSNLVHASDSIETAEAEIKRFFKEDELFDYQKTDYALINAEEHF
ncbi:MAG: nucleoside-diphosphate kinase [Candidatus Pacebacteria bacterium]|nr:nucleoside-diphosphate kinase [Candidatus Paceibacterota bacterium]